MSTVLFNRDSINSSHYLMELSLFFFKELFNLKRSSLVPVTVNRSLFVCEVRPSCGFVLPIWGGNRPKVVPHFGLV